MPEASRPRYSEEYYGASNPAAFNQPTKTLARFIKPYGEKAYEFASRLPEDDTLITILEGAVRSSKTWACLPKFLALFRYHPGGLKIITGVSKSAIYRNILNDLFTVIGKENYTYNTQSGELVMCGDHWLVIGARDEGSQKDIRGSTIGVAVCDEMTLMPKSFLQMLLTRLTLDGSRLYGTTNPDTPYHYLKTQVIDNPDYKGLLTVVHFSLDDNPNLSPQVKANLHLMFKGVFYRRYILGEWVMAEGSIYGSCFDPKLNVFKDAEEKGFIRTPLKPKPKALYGAGGYVSRTIAVDYGTTNPMVFLEILDDGQILWQISEYYWDSRDKMKQKTDREYAEDLKAFIEASPVGRTDDARVLVDPSAASFKAECLAHGLYVVDADNEVDEGIRLTSILLASRRYLIHETCTHTIEEIQNYSWDDKAALRGVEQPIKLKDHCPDAVRYKVKTDIHPWRATSG